MNAKPNLKLIKTPLDALVVAVELCGGLSKASRVLGHKYPQKLGNWIDRGTPVPIEAAVMFERHLKRPGLAATLRPDVDWELLLGLRMQS